MHESSYTPIPFNPLRIFIPLSLALLASGVAVLGASALFLEKAMDATFGVLVMSAVIVLAR